MTAIVRVPITGTFERPDGSGLPAQGHASFELTTPLLDATGKVVVAALRIPVTLTAAGAIPAGFELVATTHPDLLPEGATYQVSLELDGQARHTFLIEVDHTAVSIDLAEVARVHGGDIRYGVTQDELDTALNNHYTKAETDTGFVAQNDFDIHTHDGGGGPSVHTHELAHFLEIDGVYVGQGDADALSALKTRLWYGETDPMADPRFKARDPLSGAGDTWQQVPTA